MRIQRAVNRARGFTVPELVAIVIAAVLICLLLIPLMRAAKPRRSHISCLSNLKQVAIGFRMWSNDHEEAFPWAVSASKGGTLEFRETPEVFRHFLAASNEMNQPKILVCPRDEERTRVATWTNFSNSNVSYFINLDASEDVPTAILAGDRNITGGTSSNGYQMTFTETSQASFTRAMHDTAGNIVLADGSGAQVTPDLVTKFVRSAGTPAMRFAIPVVKSSPRSGLQVAATASRE